MTKRQAGWLLAGLFLASSAGAQTDPGPRPAPPNGPPLVGPLRGLGSSEIALFNAALTRFREVDSVSGTIAGETGSGLGPRFNLNSCSGCHAYPAIGGSSPPVNPQVKVATLDGAQNTLPSFITANGPVREVRFVSNPDGTADGGVHDLFVISGRHDAPGCKIVQPDFATAVAQHNAVFRIPTPLFGAGLVEAVPDSNLIDSAATQEALQASLGIASGVFNHSGNDGTITRFGWKAQNKSVLVFAGEAYNVEQGVTNEAFPNERETDPNCQFNGTPEDRTNLADGAPSQSPASDYSSDIVNFAAFMRLSAGPLPAPATPSTVNGQHVFASTGCAACHTPSQTTGKSAYTGQSLVSFAPYSDFALHDMGTNLADGVTQGEASGNQFRTAPLWGLGARLFFLHDGRSTNLVDAIHQHASTGSEANAVVTKFNQLAPRDQQDLVSFLRSL
jgi:CxxC motif-containing protein (DUF1111 family)